MSQPEDRPFASFLVAATSPSRFPPESVPEVALMGRSNVGKSSLLNALVGSRVARVSRTPGRTREIHFYDVRLGSGKAPVTLRLVDLPGYGYARVAREVTREWPVFIEAYLAGRSSLALCLLLVDLSVPIQDSDRGMAGTLGALGRSWAVIATKADRVPASRREAVLRGFREAFKAPLTPVSVRTGLGVREAWRTLVQAVSPVPPAGRR